MAINQSVKNISAWFRFFLPKSNTATYVATSKANFDEMFQYISVGDEQALYTLMSYGKVKELSKGTSVYLVSAHFTHKVVRLKGSSQKLWVVSEHVSK